MRSLFSFVLFVSLGVGFWWLWNNHDEFRGIINEYVENGDFLTLEAKYTPEQIIETNRKDLLGNGLQREFKEPTLKFYPYLFMEVKYTGTDKRTKEGVILWSLMDGEMVLNTETWEKTHGFADAIDARSSPYDFKILNALAKNNGTMTMDQLTKDLHLEKEAILPWLESTLEKHLVVQRGNEYKLHFQNPKILVNPQTKMTQYLVSKPYDHSQRMPKKYSQREVERTAKAAFGREFKVRSIKEVLLPVYNIEVINPDGSVLSSFWNALNGQRINPKYQNPS